VMKRPRACTVIGASGAAPLPLPPLSNRAVRSPPMVLLQAASQAPAFLSMVPQKLAMRVVRADRISRDVSSRRERILPT